MDRDYRQPEEWQATRDADDRIWQILDRAVRDGVSLVTAMRLGEPEDVVEQWINTLHNGLRASLRDDQEPVAGIRRDERIRAIVLLLTDRITRGSDGILHSLGGDA